MATSATPKRSASPGNTLHRVLITAVSVVGALALLTLCVFWFGGVRGEEFSPDTFERRHFFYYEIPLVHVQCWPIRRTPMTHSLDKFLEDQKLLPPPKKLSEQEWHLALMSRGAKLVREGDALILCSYLDTYETGGDMIWEVWSKRNAELAKILWPVLADLAHGNQYVVVPDVMDLAKSATEPAAFRKSLDQLLATQFTEMADARQKLGHHARAAELYAEALKHIPPGHADRARLEVSRKKSLDAAGPPAPAAKAKTGS